MEGKMNQDTLTEKSNFQSSELSDQELAQASGGQDDGDPIGKEYVWDVWKTDSQGRVTHWIKNTGEIVHYTCPRCGRILHEGTMGYLFCDPCDDWFSKGGANKVIDKASDETYDPF